jgi:hypothetical protein
MNAPAKDSGWHALNVDLEPSAREAVEYALMEAGALGTVTNDLDDGLLRIVEEDWRNSQHLLDEFGLKG